MASIFSSDGVHLRDILWLSDRAKKYESLTLTGVRCDRDWGSESFWCVQFQEHTVYHYDFDGNLLDSLRIDAQHYRPLDRKQPCVREDEYIPWKESWDWVTDIQVIGDKLLAVTTFTGNGHRKMDLVNAP
ncbi:MAG: hypothetical protein OXU68_10950 [Bacteroidota bacterium]|nr:hypothetical protein [Bacteroidota bacterium]